MPSSPGAEMIMPSVWHNQTIQYRPQILIRFFIPSGCNTEPILHSASASQNSNIHKFKTLTHKLIKSLLTILKIRISPVNNEVPWLSHSLNFGNNLLYLIFLIKHQPKNPRLPERLPHTLNTKRKLQFLLHEVISLIYLQLLVNLFRLIPAHN